MTAHAGTHYLGESATAGAAYRCDDCGAHWYPDMGERPPTICHPIPAARNPYAVVCASCGEPANASPLSTAGTTHRYGPVQDHDFVPSQPGAPMAR